MISTPSSAGLSRRRRNVGVGGRIDMDGAPSRAQHTPTSQIAADDWNDLFDAVKARMTEEVVREGRGAVSGAQAPSPPLRVRDSILECVEALDQLHAMLDYERARCRQMELDVSNLRAALTLARAELASTRIGEARARHLSLHDSLTALPNRRYFNERLENAVTQGSIRQRAIAVLFLDLDGFKPINDRYGHAIGDELLRIVSARMAHSLRTEDVVCRLGGDEFGCLVERFVDRAQLSHIACKLSDAVSAPYVIGKLMLSVRASIGIAASPLDGVTPDALLKSADAAMYLAKRRRTGYAFFNQQPSLTIVPCTQAAALTGK